MNILKKRDTRWFLLIPVLCISMSAVILTIIKLLLGIHLSGLDVAIVLGLSTVAAIAVCGFFYAGLKIAAYSCVTGCFAGIVYMAYVFMQPIELKGVVGIVSGVQIAFICILFGINAQMISYLFKRRKMKNEQQSRSCT